MTCKNPRCGAQFEPNHTGRPREYCTKRCRDAAYRAGPAPTPRDEWYADCAGRLAEDAARRLTEVSRHARADDLCCADTPLTSLRLVRDLLRELTDLQAVLVRQARDRRATQRRIAEAMGVTTGELARHWSAEAVERRLGRRLHRIAPLGPGSRPRVREAGDGGPAAYRCLGCPRRPGDPAGGHNRPSVPPPPLVAAPG